MTDPSTPFIATVSRTFPSKPSMRPHTCSDITTELLAERAASMLRRGDAFGQWLSVGGEEAGDGGA